MIGIDTNQAQFAVYLQTLGMRVIALRPYRGSLGEQRLCYVFNERTRISRLKEAYESGSLDILDPSHYHKKTGSQHELLPLRMRNP